ncbi:MAG: glycosyltransferase family 4 protein [Candidatus Helarchaeota archaeon]
MTVCFVAYYIWNRRLDTPSGDIVQLKSYMEALSTADIGTILYMPRRGSVRKIGKIPVIQMPYIPPPFYKYEILKHLQSMYLGLLDKKMDVNVYHLRGQSNTVFAFRRFVKKPLIATLIPMSLFGLRSKAYDQRAINKTDTIVTLSEAWRQYILETFEVEEKKVVHLPICIDVNKFSPSIFDKKLRDRFNAEHIIGYFGRIYWYQGIHQVINVLPTILKEFPSTKFLIGGHGYFKPELERQVKKMGLEENVVFLGAIPHEMIPKYYSICDILVNILLRSESHASFSRPIFISIKLLEYLAMAKPAVISDDPRLTNVFDSEYEFTAHSKRELVNLLLTCLRDKKYGEKVGNQARKLIQKRHSYEAVGKIAKQLYARFE